MVKAINHLAGYETPQVDSVVKMGRLGAAAWPNLRRGGQQHFETSLLVGRIRPRKPARRFWAIA